MKIFKFGGIFFMIVACFLLYSGIKGIIAHIEYKQKSVVSTVYITKKKFYQKRKRSKGVPFYKGDYYYLAENKDTVFFKNQRFIVFTPSKDTTQYYGIFKRRYFPSTTELSWNRPNHFEESLSGNPKLKLWTEFVPLFIALIFFVVGRVFYSIGKTENK